jgi:hypothetical protein
MAATELMVLHWQVRFLILVHIRVMRTPSNGFPMNLE